LHSAGVGKANVQVYPRTVSVSLACNPNSIDPLSSTTCTVAVQDNGPGPQIVPSGKVFFRASPGGTFSQTGGCDLASGTCSVTYTSPATSTQITVNINATYFGDSVHSGGSQTANVLVSPRAISVSVACQPNDVKSHTSTLCTVTVTDTGSGTPIIPAGTVSFTSDSGGTFSSTQCTLTSGSCSVTFIAPSVSVQTRVTITAIYSGDGVHSGGSGQTVIRVK
jgi:hypothetical protein